jgi:integrase
MQHATLLLQRGAQPKVVSERLGHSTIGITMDTYTHVLPNMQKEAALHRAAHQIEYENGNKVNVTRMRPK